MAQDETTDNLLLFGDCFDILPNLPEHSVDFICIDPPYGMTAPKWDREVDLERLWKEFHRIGKKNCVVAIFGSQPFTTKVISSNLKEFKYCWYWIKNQGTNFFHAKRMPIRKVEEIMVFGGSIYNPQITDGHVPTRPAKGSSNGEAYFGNGKRNYEGGSTTRLPTNVLDFKCVDNYSRVHSSQKPVELLEYLVRTYTGVGDVVLDCFAGSGTTLIAAKNAGRRYIGVEKDESYFELCKKRLATLS